MHTRFPYQISETGSTATNERAEYLRGLIEQVIFTAPGERVNRPTFGSGVYQLVFEPNNVELAATVQFLIASALQQWLGDLIEVGEVRVSTDNSSLSVLVTYRELLATTTTEVTFNRAI